MTSDDEFPEIYNKMSVVWEGLLQSRFPDIVWVVDRYEDVRANNQIEYNASGRQLITGIYITGKTASNKQKRSTVSVSKNPDGHGQGRSLDELESAIISTGNQIRKELLAQSE